MPNEATATMLAHNVYFTLKDASNGEPEKLVEACHRYLKDHPGVVFFAAGTLVDDLNRPVNVRGFHVGLHVIFRDRQAHDEYQVSEKHQQFIAENKGQWAQVQVYDTGVR